MPKAAKPVVTPDAPVEVDRRVWWQWRHAKRMEGVWKERKERLAEKLKEAIDDAPGATINGVQVIRWTRNDKKHKFNMAKFKAEHPDLFAEYDELVEGDRPFNEANFDETEIEEGHEDTAL